MYFEDNNSTNISNGKGGGGGGVQNDQFGFITRGFSA